MLLKYVVNYRVDKCLSLVDLFYYQRQSLDSIRLCVRRHALHGAQVAKSPPAEEYICFAPPDRGEHAALLLRPGYLGVDEILRVAPTLVVRVCDKQLQPRAARVSRRRLVLGTAQYLDVLEEATVPYVCLVLAL